jgi:N-methylhydantoinase B
MFDVDAGLVTVQGARRYGVVIGADGRADRAASAALRATMSKERGPVKLFDRGFESIAELKDRCLAETGLAPPEQPRFLKQSARSGRRAG